MMMPRFAYQNDRLGRVLCAIVLFMTSATQAASPALQQIMPRGGQRCQEVLLQFQGERLKDAEEVLFYAPGLEVLEFKVENDKRIDVLVRIAADCALGEHLMRVRTATGISELQSFYVGSYPIIDEKENNSDFSEPQPIEMNVTVHGVVTGEDVDYFAVEAKKGDRLSVEIEAIRLGGVLFDPYIAIMNPARFELVSVDDTALLKQDAACSLIVPEDGTYTIQVRETSYGGNERCHYRLHVGRFARPMIAYPAGGKVGQSLNVQLIGDAAGPIDRTVDLPSEPSDRYPLYVQDDGLDTPSPLYLRISPFENVLEVEPNDNRNQQATRTDLVPPFALNGIIAKPGDHDWFTFTGKKGQVLDFRVHARSLGSPLDAVINLYGPDTKHLQGNDDDSNLPDSYFRFTLPEDGDYQLRVRDHLGQGGANYVYRVELTEVQPAVSATFPDFDRRNPQARQHIAVPRGNNYATLMRITRRDIGGAFQLEADDLPDGMIMHVHPIPGNLNEALILFEAREDAPIAGHLSRVIVRSADEKKSIRGSYVQNVPLVGGSQNNPVFHAAQVDRLAVAVTREVPFRVRIVEPQVPIVRDGEMQLKVVVEREDGFDRDIDLRLPFRPPGLSANNVVKIEKGKNEAYFTINANGNAATGDWPLTVTATAGSGHGPVWIAAPFATLQVTEPFIGGQIEMAAAEQSKTATVICKLDHHKPFTGQAIIKLLGLPPKVKLKNPEIKITGDDAQVMFEIEAEPDAPKGQHKTLFCQVEIVQNGESILHTIAKGGTLRIDAPPSNQSRPKSKKAKNEDEKNVVGEKVKPLSRLEKLRMQQQDQSP